MTETPPGPPGEAVAHPPPTGASGFQYWAPFVLAGVALPLGVPVYFAQRGKMTQPETVPEYR